MPATPLLQLLRPFFVRHLSLALLGVGSALPAATALAAGPSQCVARLVPAESQDVTCPLAASMIGRPVRFVAQFAGSHDDTRLKLTATLAGEPLVCEAGSRTSLAAEDGEVGLDCRFTAPRDRAADAVLQVVLSVHHAQFLSAEVVAE